MKTLNNIKTLKTAFTRISVIAFLITAGLSSQQASAQYTLTTSSQITVAGTSNLHDWTMDASKFSCDAKMVVANGQLKDITSLVWTLPVKNLKSKESLMDTRAYKALKADTHDKMIFKLTDATVIESKKIVNVTGNLTISGVTKSITIQSNYVVAADESVNFKGSKAIKMSDFGIKAPQFMMGALKTGDDLTINIALKLKK